MSNTTRIQSTEDLSRILKALSDTNRLNIVVSIGKKDCSVSEIIKATGLSQTLVSFHLRALREANIVTTERNGPFILYSLSDANLNKTLINLAKSINPNGKKIKESPKPNLQTYRNKRR